MILFEFMNALELITEPIRKSTINYFKHKVTGDLYEGPFFLCDDGRLRISNQRTHQWEFLDLKDLKNLEKITSEEGEKLIKSYRGH